MRKHINLVLLLLLFVLPVVVAKLVLDNHWYQGAPSIGGSYWMSLW
ncbi:hypothetical protein [Photobacterium sp. Hal280]